MALRLTLAAVLLDGLLEGLCACASMISETLAGFAQGVACCVVGDWLLPLQVLSILVFVRSILTKSNCGVAAMLPLLLLPSATRAVAPVAWVPWELKLSAFCKEATKRLTFGGPLVLAFILFAGDG